MGQSSGEVIALAIIFPILALLVVLLRVWARRVKKQVLAWDDYMIFIAMFFLVGADMIPTLILARDDNLGNHERYKDGVPVKSTYRANVCQFIAEVMGHFAIGLAKCSILLLYLRIFNGKLFYIATWTMFGLVVAWMISFFFASLFECTPIPLYLRKGSHGAGVHCFNTLHLYYAHAYSDVIMDGIIILLVPWLQIWKLHMPLKTKAAVTAILLLGLLTIAASITRLIEFRRAGNLIRHGDTDRDYVAAPTVYWTTIEASLGIIAATLPTLRPIFMHMSPESVAASIRSVFSLPSIRSNLRSNAAESAAPKSSASSLEGLQNPAGVGSVGAHETFIEGPGLYLSSGPREHHELKDGITVQSTWGNSDSAV